MKKELLKKEETEEVVCPRCEKEVIRDSIICPFCGFGILAWLEGEIDKNGRSTK